MADHQLKIQIRNNYIQLNSNQSNKLQLTHHLAVTMVIHNYQLRNSLMELNHFNSQLCLCLRPQLYLVKCHKVNRQLLLVLNKMALITNLSRYNPNHNNNTSANPNKQLVTVKHSSHNNKVSTLIKTRPLNNRMFNSHNTNSHNSNSCRNSSSSHNSNNSLRQSPIQTSNPNKIVIQIKSLNQ